MDWTLIAVVGIVVTGFATVWIYDLRFRHTYTKGYVGLNKEKPKPTTDAGNYKPWDTYKTGVVEVTYPSESTWTATKPTHKTKRKRKP